MIFLVLSSFCIDSTRPYTRFILRSFLTYAVIIFVIPARSIHRTNEQMNILRNNISCYTRVGFLLFATVYCCHTPAHGDFYRFTLPVRIGFGSSEMWSEQRGVCIIIIITYTGWHRPACHAPPLAIVNRSTRRQFSVENRNVFLDFSERESKS